MTPVLLVGSLPLGSAEEVFTTVAALLGDRLSRMPDGETGARRNWIAWQRQAFVAIPELEPLAAKERDYQLSPPFRLRDGARAADVRFGPLGFRDAAIESYRVFQRLKDAGRIAQSMRLQIALPTPFAPSYSFLAYEAQEPLYPAYEAALLGELAEIARVVPAEELAVQWDVATEMSIWEQLYPVTFGDPKAVMIRRLARLGEAVPEGVELAYHLCYGSMNNRHWKEPIDTGKLTEVANALIRSVKRRVDWLHMPVPIARDDAAYFAPLRNLALPDETTLFLGLLHLEDGVAGAQRRAAAARGFVPRFGIAAECGLGRRPDATIPAWLTLHAEAARVLRD